MNAVAPVEPDTWFVTAPRSAFVVSVEDGSPWTTHAKTVGTLFTACGLNASFWRMLWELRFPAPGLVACAACAEIIEALSSTAGPDDAGPGGSVRRSHSAEVRDTPRVMEAIPRSTRDE